MPGVHVFMVLVQSDFGFRRAKPSGDLGMHTSSSGLVYNSSYILYCIYKSILIKKCAQDWPVLKSQMEIVSCETMYGVKRRNVPCTPPTVQVCTKSSTLPFLLGRACSGHILSIAGGLFKAWSRGFSFPFHLLLYRYGRVWSFTNGESTKDILGAEVSWAGCEHLVLLLEIFPNV